MKKLLAIALCIFLLIAALPYKATGEESTITAENQNGSMISISGVNRPIRAANEMILFTRENQSPKTDSNPWCAAAIVDYVDGRYVVVEIKYREGAVDIPYNGFVLFGHGTSEEWILNNLKVGDEIIIKGYTLPEVILGPKIGLEDGTWYEVDGVNVQGEADALIIYTSEYGQWTDAFDATVAQAIVVNGIVVEVNTDGSKGTYIPGNGYVLSGSGNKRELIQGLKIGERVETANITISTVPERYAVINGIIVPIDKVNSARGTNEVILYDSSYGTSTRTNPWGMEITVVDNVIVNVKGFDGTNNDSSIPSNGVVISIHMGSPYYEMLNGQVAIGGAVQIVMEERYVYNASKTSYDAMNPKSREDNPKGWNDSTNAPYPGFRGTDQLIIYDRSYGNNTGTNQWGYEVTVNGEGKIVKVGGNSNDIPEEGFVLSGHGVKADWLKKHALIGATVDIDTDKKEVLILFTPESHIERSRLGIREEESRFINSKENFLDIRYQDVERYINNAKNYVAAAETKLAEKNYTEMLKILDKAEAEISNAHFSNYESRKVETRAVWIRPKETNAEQVAKLLDELQALNINTIYLETWWDGYTIYPTENTITEQNPIFGGFDVLKCYIEEAHKRGMELHAWVETFLVGVGASGTDEGGPVKAKKPEWLLISRKGDNFELVGEYNAKFYFANPALPEVRDFIMDIYLEIVKKYDIDGLQLDYIRYPDAKDGSNDFGYDSYTRSLFQQEYGVDPITVTPGHELWTEWCKFRANFVSTFVYRVFNEIKAVRPDVEISADVWTDYVNGPVVKMQDVKDWVSKGYIDTVIPMSYTLDSKAAAADTRNTKEFADKKALVTVGLSAQIGLTPEELVEQVLAANNNMAEGTAIFEADAFLRNKYGDKLVKGIYSNKAISPSKDPVNSIKVMLEEVRRKISEIYLPYGGMDKAKASRYLNEIKSILDSNVFKEKGKTKWKDLEKVEVKIENLLKSISADTSINSKVVDRIKYDLNRCISILGESIFKGAFMESHKVEKLIVECPISRVGDSAEVRVKAVFEEGEDVIMYVDPSHFKVRCSNPNVLHVDGTVARAVGPGKANIMVTISNEFLFKVSGSKTVVLPVIVE